MKREDFDEAMNLYRRLTYLVNTKNAPKFLNDALCDEYTFRPLDYSDVAESPYRLRGTEDEA